MKKFLPSTILALLIGLWIVPNVYGQQKVTGQVLDFSSNEPLPGVSILIKGTSTGTTTNVDGQFSMEVPNNNAELVFSFIGYGKQIVKVGNNTNLTVKLEAKVTELEEVVVTALGIEKEAREVTYSTQTISGEELTTVKDQNLVNTLAGKTAGITISRSAGGVGSSSRVLLRGNKSISGQNQPLYVIDGVPMNNTNLGTAGNLFGNSVDNGDPIANLNPEDIENISVLKGASAAALYGSQAANGVILITTKKGKKGVSEIAFSSSLQFESPLMTPELQSKYGQKDPGSASSLGTWGDTKVGASTDHVDDFYTTGTNFINSISLSNGNDQGQYRISYARTDANGIVPGNEMYKNNFSIRGTTKIFEKVSLDGSATLINQRIENTPFPGFYHNPVLSTYLFPETMASWETYKNNFEVFDESRNLMVQNYPYKDQNYAFTNENPYWIINRQQNDSWRNRSIYKLSATIPVMEKLSVIGRINYDRTEDKFEHRLHATSSSITVNPGGDYQTRDQVATLLYSDLLLTYDNYFNNTISLSATGGFSNTYNTTESMNFQSTTDNTVGLIVPNWFALQNFEQGFIRQEADTETFLQALFGTATVGYKEIIFADITLRNEWSSTLQPDNNTFLYPSGGLTFILTEMVGSNNLFSFAKVRGSYSEVGNALPFGVAFSQPRTINGRGQISAPIAAPLGTLNPERSKSLEIGTYLRFLGNLVELDLTYYNNKIEDQFFTIPAAVGDAYQNYFINGGTVRNKGVEAVLSFNLPISNELKYSTSFNFSTNKNKVLEIDPRLEGNRFIVTPFADSRMFEIRVQEGGSYGDFYGVDLLRDANGNIVYNQESEDGNITIERTPTSELVYLGNPNPDWQLGWQNAFSYKNLTFKFLIDGKFGGEVISQTEAILDSYGRTQRTADARDAGAVVIGDQSFDPEVYYTNIGGLAGVGSQYVYDATNIRLREFSLGYTLPAGLFNGFAKKLTLSAIGRNLFFLHNNAPFDPEVSPGAGAAYQGVHSFLVPATRSYGFSLNVTF